MAARIYMLFSSSKGNCCLIENGSDRFLIDAGVSARRIEQALAALQVSPDRLCGIFITHEHSDHIKGLDTLCKKYALPVYAPSGCFATICATCPSAAPYLRRNDPCTLTELNESRIYAVRTPHDAEASVGFRMELSGEKCAYFTDIGHLSSEVVRALSGCSRIVIESNHDLDLLKNGPYPPSLKRRIAGPYGHLSNFDCAALLPHLANYGTKRVVLAHLSEHNNTPALAFEESFARAGSCLSIAVASPTETVEV